MQTQESVAVYWDFENIHASLVEVEKGSNSYKQCRNAPQDAVVDVNAVMEFVASLGRVAINRAYGNWQFFGKYRQALLHNAVELIQLFQPGNAAKNGADIKLCLDATEDIIRFPHISTIVIVGGDSDFLPVAQKIKAAGRTLVGVGCEKNTNKHWAHSCHEFLYYEKLILDELPAGVIAASEDEGLAAPEAVRIIHRAIARLAATKGDSWVLKASIRPMVKRLDPTFDETRHGGKTFSELLKKYADYFEVRKGEHDQEYRIIKAVLSTAASEGSVHLAPDDESLKETQVGPLQTA